MVLSSSLFKKAIKCGRLRKPSFGAIYPETCAQRKMPFGQRCAFACQPGFELTGPSLRECILPGIWTGGTLSTRCLGIYQGSSLNHVDMCFGIFETLFSCPLGLWMPPYIISFLTEVVFRPSSWLFLDFIISTYSKFYFLDTTPPQINCPENVIINTDPELYYATLNLSLPNGFGKYLKLNCNCL